MKPKALICEIRDVLELAFGRNEKLRMSITVIKHLLLHVQQSQATTLIVERGHQCFSASFSTVHPHTTCPAVKTKGSVVEY
jgi:hypothetical protein